MGKNDEKSTTTIAPGATGNGSASSGPPAPGSKPDQKPETGKSQTPPAETKPKASGKAKAPAPELKDVDVRIAERNLPPWMGASIKVFAGWSSGKAVTAGEFNEVVTKWNKRKQGSGRRR